jgi:hypothetical protein
MESRCGETRGHQEKKGGAKIVLVNGEVILENVRRYRAIASLYRRTAAFRPLQSWSLLEQAEEWEHLALTELETYFMAGTVEYDKQPQVAPYTYAPWETMAAA